MKLFEMTVKVDVVADSEAEALEHLQREMDNVITLNGKNPDVLGYGIERDQTTQYGCVASCESAYKAGFLEGINNTTKALRGEADD